MSWRHACLVGPFGRGAFSMEERTFGTVINCMDGRVQLPVIDWMKEKYGLDYVDVITEAGPDWIMSSGNVMRISYIKSRVEVSVKQHGSGVIAIVGHEDCAGNPVSKEVHLVQLMKSVKVIERWGMPVEVVALWVNEDWEVEQIDPE